MRPRTLRRRLALAGFGAILAGALLGTGIAKADYSMRTPHLGCVAGQSIAGAR